MNDIHYFILNLTVIIAIITVLIVRIVFAFLERKQIREYRRQREKLYSEEIIYLTEAFAKIAKYNLQQLSKETEQ